jgi:hypothetical protein
VLQAFCKTSGFDFAIQRHSHIKARHDCSLQVLCCFEGMGWNVYYSGGLKGKEEIEVMDVNDDVDDQEPFDRRRR